MERSDIHVLTETIQHMRKCLECSICLSTPVTPVTTPCVHIFCQKCIGRIVAKRGAKCPLCNEKLSRRRIFRTELVESYVNQFKKLVSAIELDTGIDVLSYTTVPRHSKECNTPAKVDPPGGSTQVESALARAKESTPQTSGRLQGEQCKMPPQSSSNRNQNTDVYLEQPSTSKDLRFNVPFDASARVHCDKTMMMEETAATSESSSNHETRGIEASSSNVNAVRSLHYRCDPSNSNRVSSDKLSSSNQNWSQVKMFGKDMRKRKRKKMSPLEISIESGKRTAEKSAEAAGKNNPARTGPSWELEQQSTNNSGRNESHMPESLKGALMPDNELLWPSETPSNIGNTYPRASSTPKNIGEVTSPNISLKSTPSDTLPLPGSPFVTLQGGTQVHIRSLNDLQMKDILGITQSISPDEKDRPLKKRSMPHQDIDPRLTDRSDWISQKKSPLAQAPMQSDKSNYLRTPPLRSPPPARQRQKPVVIETQLLPSLQLSATPRGGLSSKEGKDIPKARSSQSIQISPRLSTVKRDLSKEITEIVKTTASTSTRPVSVAFKKLGKMTVQGRTKPCKFLYLGSCRRAIEANFPTYSYIANSLKPCNTVERRASEITCNLSQSQDNSENDVEMTFTRTMVATGNNEGGSSMKGSNEMIKANTSSRMKTISEVEMISHDSDEMGNQTGAKKSMRVNVTADSVNTKVPAEESVDVVLDSLPEPTAQSIPAPNTTINEESNNESSIGKKPTHITGTKMLSPEKDSQLQFLSRDSPIAENARLLIRQRSAADADRNNSFNSFEVKGAHSKELIRRSQQSSSGNTESDSSNADRKRKRSSGIGALSQSEKESNKAKEMETEAFVDLDSSPESIFSMATQKKPKSQVNVIKSSSEENQKSYRIVSHSSDTDVMSDTEEPARKKKYKRIRRVSSTSTDSVEVIDVESNNQFLAKDSSHHLNPTPTKRSFLPDVDVNINIEEIAESWCTDAYARGLHTKKEGTNPQSVSSCLIRDNYQSIREKSLVEANKSRASGAGNLPTTLSTGNDTLSSAKDLFDSGPYSVEKQAEYASAKTHGGQDDVHVVMEEKDEVNSIIDRVRQMQKGESNRVTSCSDTHRRDSQKNEGSMSDLLHDNFNDIMANVDTAILMDNATLSPKNAGKSTDGRNDAVSHKSAEKSDVPKTPESRSSRTETMSPRSSCASDKENRDCQRLHNVSNFGKRKNDRERTPVKSDRMNTLCRTPRSTTSNSSPSRLSIRSPAEINKKACENYNQLSREIAHDDTARDNTSARESSNEQDSLMNITQQQLLLQQFEEDLFNPGRAQTSPKTPKSQSSRTSEQKDTESTGRKKNPNEESSGPIPKDTECSSAEEDDIVESTPETKTKTSTSNNSSTRISVATPVLRNVCEQSPASEESTVRKVTDNTTIVNAKKAIALMQQSSQLVPHSSTTSPNSREGGNTSSGSSVIGRVRSLYFVCSSLGSVQVRRTRELAGLVSGYYANQFHPEVTHVIVKVDQETNTADKTLKYLQGVAHRKWVVGFKWVEECLRQRRLVDEEPYEVLDSYTFEPGPRNSRLRQSELFEDFAFLCCGPYVNITTEQYKDLLLATGGEIVESLEALAASARKYRIIVIQPDEHQDQIMAWYRNARAVPIADDWIVECISQYKLVSLYAYLQVLLPNNILELGYPEFLIEEDVEGDDNMDVSET